MNQKPAPFRWGPIPGRLFSISNWLSIYTDRPDRIHHELWSLTYAVIKDGQMLLVCPQPALDQVGERVLRKYLMANRRPYYFQQWKLVRARVQQAVTQIEQTSIRSLPDEELTKLWSDFCHELLLFWDVSVLPELAAIGGQPVLQRLLQQQLNDPETLNALAILTAPTEPSFYQREEQDLARLLSRRRTSRMVEKRLRQHAERYAWIENSYHLTHRARRSSFRRRLKELAQKYGSWRTYQRQQLSQQKEQNRERRKIFGTLRHRREIRRISEAVSFAVAWQDDRKAQIFQYLVQLDRLAREFERRAKIKPFDFDHVYYTEVTTKPTIKLRQLIARRKKLFASRWSPNNFQHDLPVTPGRRQYRKLWSAPVALSTTLHGLVAYGSNVIVRAPVFVVRNIGDLRKFPKGSVLVAGMTAPEYVTAMRRAAAIVTDAGGVISHAAVVSRELEVPCIVGTRYATSVLKNGDTVEVDSGKGTVRKL